MPRDRNELEASLRAVRSQVRSLHCAQMHLRKSGCSPDGTLEAIEHVLDLKTSELRALYSATQSAAKALGEELLGFDGRSMYGKME